MKASHTLDTIRTSFDEEHLVANAGLLLPATLMQRLGVCELLDEHVDLGPVPGAANIGLKGSALVAALIVGAKWINDVAVLRAGETLECLRALGQFWGSIEVDSDPQRGRDYRPPLTLSCQPHAGARTLPG